MLFQAFSALIIESQALNEVQMNS